MNFANQIYHNIPTPDAPEGKCELVTTETSMFTFSDDPTRFDVSRKTVIRALGWCVTGSSRTRVETTQGKPEVVAHSVANFIGNHIGVVVTEGTGKVGAQEMADAYWSDRVQQSIEDERLAAVMPDDRSKMVAVELQGAAAQILNSQRAGRPQA